MSSTATPSDRGRGKPRQRKDGNHDGGGSGREAPGSGSGKEGGRGRGGRGRGSRGGSSRGAGRSPGSMSQKPKKREFFDGVEDSTALETLDKPTEDVTEEDIEITDLSYVGSYSWVERDKPTIIVPGSPRIWQERTLPFTVERDSGINFVDNNGHRVPSSPLLPLFRAVDIVAKTKKDVIDWPSVDFVTDRNNLRKLLRWITGTGGQKSEFRIDMQLAGKRTVLLNRWEQFTTRYAREESSGYGFSFERATTTPEKGCEQGVSHHRVLKYDLGGLNLIVRFEVDACLPTDSASKVTDQETKSLDDLSSQLSNFSLTSSSSQEKASSGPSINIIMGGREVPQGTLVEMTCRAEGKLKWADSYPQLFLTQIPHFFLATHNNGVVTHISDNKLSSENMIEKNKTLQPAFQKLKLVLEMIQESAVLHGNGARLSLLCQKGELKIYKRKSQESCLPEDILRRFDVT